jgi:hypothetical protein
MPLTDAQLRFIARRRPLVRLGTPVFTVMLVAFLACAGLLIHGSQLLFNPWHVYDRLLAGTISACMLRSMAFMLPVMSLVTLFVMLVLILFSFVALAQEKKYLGIIDALQSGNDTPPAEETPADEEGGPAEA